MLLNPARQATAALPRPRWCPQPFASWSGSRGTRSGAGVSRQRGAASPLLPARFPSTRLPPTEAGASQPIAAGEANSTLLYYPRREHALQWERALRGADPCMSLIVFNTEDQAENQSICWEEIGFAIVWKPPQGLLNQCPNLKGIQLTGAGVDSVLSNNLVPLSVPIARIVDPVMAQSMGTYILCAVLNLHRKTDDYLEAQRNREWIQLLVYEEKVLPSEMHVGFLGFGEMARVPAQMLTNIGYKVSGWTRSRPRQVDGVTVYTGAESLGEFLSELDVVVCLLPLTSATRGMVDKDLLYKLPRGASVVNVGRGGHLVVDDLIKALDDGQISRAVLDVFEPEPLPFDSPLWKHPRVRITPHVSAKTNMESSVSQILENRRRALEGDFPLENQVDVAAGY